MASEDIYAYSPPHISREDFLAAIKEPQPPNYEPVQDIKKVIFLPDKKRSLSKEVVSLYQLGSGVMAVMYAMPEEITNWDRSTPPSFERWKENATKAPVKDEDSWQINLVGHPVSGAVYYVSARQAGLSRVQALSFSLAMSTLYWEYGKEAIIENPSQQDLIYTPFLGALIGEQAYQLNLLVRENGGTLLGSKTLGSWTVKLTDPSGTLQDLINAAVEDELIDSIHMGLSPINIFEPENPHFQAEQIIGFRVLVHFGK